MCIGDRGFANDKGKVFEIAIQTGAIFAVILVYWEKIRATVLALPRERDAQRFALNVLIGFLPAVVLGLLFGKAIKAHLFTPVVVASTFIAGGLVILWAERRQARRDADPVAYPQAVATVDDMTLLDALKVGLVQCLAMVPGTSRSGATIIGGMLLGLSRKAATDFSFFLAIPTLIGAGAYSLYKERALLSLTDLPLFAVGLLFSFASAWLCVRWLLRFISTHSFTGFACPRCIFGLGVMDLGRWVGVGGTPWAGGRGLAVLPGHGGVHAVGGVAVQRAGGALCALRVGAVMEAAGVPLTACGRSNGGGWCLSEL